MVKKWIQNFTKALMKSPAGVPIVTTIASAALEGNVRPWLQNHGSDMAISVTNDLKAIQIDFANRSLGQTTVLWRAPQPILAQPQQLIPIDQLWANIQSAQAAQQVANAEEEAD